MLGLFTLCAAAHAASGGSGVGGPQARSPKPAVPESAPRAQLADVRCVANPSGACIESHRSERGGTVSLTGRSLAVATQVIFYGAKGGRDDALAPVQSASRSRVLASVPPQAQSGPIAVIDATGKRSTRWEGLFVESPEDGLGALRPASALMPVQVAVSQPRRIFFGGMQKALFNFRITGGRALDLEVDLLRLSDNAVIRRWQRTAVQPGALQRIVWNGATGGRAQPDGRYAFRVASPAVVGSSAQAPPPGGDESVTLVGYMFPIRGPHQFNLGAGRFGAAREGHVHQGQDVIAACGTPLVAARGGTVLYSGYHALAGYYVVIDGQGTGVDQAYMHLREPALVSTGARIYTGQPIGEVGDTGDAQGCHLHFEEWSPPGWYKGGRPFDPLADLRRWDASS
jgi:murein DD-endopeptidase MepM/ murein hydrolase activator NlpD